MSQNIVPPEEAQLVATRVSVVSMAGNALLTVFKLAAGLLAHSGAMVSDAIHSASDILASFVVIAGVRISAKAPDKDHPYGHERYECVAAIVLATVLVMVGGSIGLGAVRSIFSGAYLQQELPGMLALAAAVVSIAAKEGMFWYTHLHAKRIGSTALNAEAWHQRSDALSSIGALIGIAGARLGVPVMEPIASVVICLFILRVALQIYKEAVDQMVDHACDPALETALRQEAASRPGVQGIDMLQTRMFGSRVYVDLEIAVDPTLSVIQAHTIAEAVHASIEARFPHIILNGEISSRRADIQAIIDQLDEQAE